MGRLQSHSCIVIGIRLDTGREVFGENFIALPRKRKIFFRNPSFVMCRNRQRHLVKANVDIRMVMAFLSFPGDSVDKSDGFQKPLKPFSRSARGISAGSVEVLTGFGVTQGMPPG